jgi:signal transduction histidine kinase/transcriptional regulator with XRE-family HTH domain
MEIYHRGGFQRKVAPMPRDAVDLSAFGTFIREQRTHLQLTQNQLADRLGWTQERISTLENGKYGVPSVPALLRLAVALEVPVLMLVQPLGFPTLGPDLDGASSHLSESTVALQYTLQRLLAIKAMTLKDALDEASDQMAVAMGADKVDAFMYDAPSNSLVALGTSNTPMGRLQHQSGLNRVPLANRERTALVYESGEPFCTGDAQTDPHIARGQKETLGVRSVLALPLYVDERIQGVLVAESTHPNRFSVEEQRFFVAASHWVGMIAHRALLAEAMQRTAAETARREAADEVITVLAHDLGNLITPLKGRLDLLRRRLASSGHERELQHVQQAARSVTGIQELVARLLDAARLDQGLFTLALQPVDLAGLVEDVAAELRPSWSEIVVRASDVPEVAGDPVRLREILVNLMTNAMQHAPAGTPITLGVGSELRDTERWVVASVTDEGPGIASELLLHLFERYRGGSRTHGMGLGLYLSRRLVEAHGGTLTVETARGQGTTFRISLPANGIYTTPSLP